MKYQPILSHLLANPEDTITLATNGELDKAKGALLSGLNRAKAQYNNRCLITNCTPLTDSFKITIVEPDQLTVQLTDNTKVSFEVVGVDTPASLPPATGEQDNGSEQV